MAFPPRHCVDVLDGRPRILRTGGRASGDPCLRARARTLLPLALQSKSAQGDRGALRTAARTVRSEPIERRDHRRRPAWTWRPSPEWPGSGGLLTTAWRRVGWSLPPLAHARGRGGGAEKRRETLGRAAISGDSPTSPREDRERGQPAGWPCSHTHRGNATAGRSGRNAGESAGQGGGQRRVEQGRAARAPAARSPGSRARARCGPRPAPP